MKTHTAPRGMTLVEILFAFAIIGTVVTVAYSAALRAWRTAVSANQRTQAQYLAQDQLERVRAFRSLSIVPVVGSPITQTGMDWENFLTTLYTNPADGIRVVACSELTPPESSCVWRAELVTSSTPDLRVTGDNSTSYKVSILPVGLYCAGGSPANPSSPSDCTSVASVDLQARVTWTDSNGLPNNQLIATTQLLAPSE